MEDITPVNGVALVTGAARRIGASIARTLHGAGMNVALHYLRSRAAAETLREELEAQRPDSVTALRADLRDTASLEPLVACATQRWRRLDLLVNNASSFYPTPLAEATEAQWNDLMDTNLKAPFFLARAAAPALRRTGGSIVNIVDIHAERPLAGHPIYCVAKAGLTMLTRSLARELGPAVRVNAIAPGAILWPESGVGSDHRRRVLAGVPLGRTGEPGEVARAVLFLARDGSYITGQVLAVDGGRTVLP